MVDSSGLTPAEWLAMMNAAEMAPFDDGSHLWEILSDIEQSGGPGNSVDLPADQRTLRHTIACVQSLIERGYLEVRLIGDDDTDRRVPLVAEALAIVADAQRWQYPAMSVKIHLTEDGARRFSWSPPG